MFNRILDMNCREKYTEIRENLITTSNKTSWSILHYLKITNILPSHWTPSPLKPGSHRQVKLPSVLVQIALSSQLSVSSTHSSISVWIKVISVITVFRFIYSSHIFIHLRASNSKWSGFRSVSNIDVYDREMLDRVDASSLWPKFRLALLRNEGGHGGVVVTKDDNIIITHFEA